MKGKHYKPITLTHYLYQNSVIVMMITGQSPITQKRLSTKLMQIGANNIARFKEEVSHPTIKELDKSWLQHQLIQSYTDVYDCRLDNAVQQREQQFHASYQKLRVMVKRASERLRKLKMMLPSTDKHHQSDSTFQNEYLAKELSYNYELRERVREYNHKIDQQLKVINDLRKVTKQKKQAIKDLLEVHMKERDNSLKRNINNRMCTNTTRSLSSGKARDLSGHKDIIKIDDYCLGQYLTQPNYESFKSQREVIDQKNLQKLKKDIKHVQTSFLEKKHVITSRITFKIQINKYLKTTLKDLIPQKIGSLSTSPKNNPQQQSEIFISIDDYLRLGQTQYMLFLMDKQPILEPLLNRLFRGNEIEASLVSQKLQKLSQSLK